LRSNRAYIGPFQQRKARGVAVFFITGRQEKERPVTQGNLELAGYKGAAALLMEPDGLHVESAADFKAPQRAKIEDQGFEIIANIGDQPSDLAGGHADAAFCYPILSTEFDRSRISCGIESYCSPITSAPSRSSVAARYFGGLIGLAKRFSQLHWSALLVSDPACVMAAPAIKPGWSN